MMTVLSTSPMPGALVSSLNSARGFTRSRSRASILSIWALSVWMTATLAAIASRTSSGCANFCSASSVSAFTARLAIRAPVCRAMMFSTDRIWLVRLLPNCRRFLAKSRSARSCGGQM